MATARFCLCLQRALLAQPPTAKPKNDRPWCEADQSEAGVTSELLAEKVGAASLWNGLSPQEKSKSGVFFFFFSLLSPLPK